MKIKIFTDYTFGKHRQEKHSRMQTDVNDFIEHIEKEGYHVVDIKISSWGDDGECESTIVVMYERVTLADEYEFIDNS